MITFSQFFESFSSHDIDMNRAYEIFNQEYIKSTGKSWTKDKFLQRAENWDFYGDNNGFITARPQASGFVKLVGASLWRVMGTYLWNYWKRIIRIR